MTDLFDTAPREDPADPFAGPSPIEARKTPRSADDRRDWLRLARSSGVGPATFIRLLRRHPSAAAALDALPGLAARGGRRTVAPAPRDLVDAELEAGERIGARLLCLGAPDYPPLLAQIDAPPPALWILGAPDRLAAPAIAIVGARNASANARRWTEALARGLAERGACVISGLARGVDAAAHAGARDAQADGAPGATVAAVAGGVDHLYPPEHAELRTRLIETGAVVSEMPIGLEPTAQHFPRRNRIISGLSQLVLVAEAAERSGALITARYAAEQGREAAAVPGHPLDPRYGGCNALLRQGATLIRDLDDAWEALESARPQRLLEPGAWFDPALTPDAPALDDEADDLAETDAAGPAALPDRILAALGPAPIEIDQLARALDLAPHALAAALLELELSGQVERRPGGQVALLQIARADG